MIVCGIDAETTSLDTDTCRIIEIAAILWHVERKQPLDIFSALICDEEVIKEGVPPEITQLTGIETEDLEAFGMSPEGAIDQLISMTNRCNAVVAHNGAAFDRLVIGRYVSEMAKSNALTIKPEKRIWIDTLTDPPYGPQFKNRQLRYLALDHGIMPSLAHRSLFDAMLSLQILSQYDFETVLERAKSEVIEVKAFVSFDDNHLAKERRFLWNPEGKYWWKPVKQLELEELRQEAPFKIEVLRTIAGAQG